jgi:hypothetical protein
MAIVNEWIEENVPKSLVTEFIQEMCKWDESLIGIHYNFWPSYDNDVLETCLEYAKKNRMYE